MLFRSYLSEEARVAREQTALAVAPALEKPAMVIEGEKDTLVTRPGVQAEYDWLRGNEGGR